MQGEVQNQVTLPQDDACDSVSSPIINALEKHMEKWYPERRSDSELNKLQRHTINTVDRHLQGPRGMNRVP